ncbi:hypothetical protein CDL15_Pgr013227 [Punica granatum]|uniref:Uncharacterized protein n=1 Tax=Punica granatum TaxID=22663 RepID=A0A218WNX3_PUNGR|nr:hypothetical protein CDL15_Pgr013227 [Punica granatum]
MLYLASGYEERVEEVFESRVTRLNPWKGVRVQGKHARMGWEARMDMHGRDRELRNVSGARAQRVDVVTGAGACTRTDEREGVCARGDAERLALELVTGALFTREHNLHPKR